VNKNELTFEMMHEGMTFSPYECVVTNVEVNFFLRATADDNDLYTEKQVNEPVYIPPAMSYIFFRRSYLNDMAMPGGGFVRSMKFNVCGTAKTGEKLITQSIVKEKYEANGQKRITIEGTTSNPEGKKIFIITLAAVWPR